MELEPLEIAVIQKLLDAEHPALVSLRQQVPRLSVSSRERTGVGFFTEFAVTGNAAPALLTPRIRFGDVEAMIPGLEHGAGFVLYIDDGLLHRLEGYTYDERWPEQVETFTLRYSDPDRKAVAKTFG
jgi:hypothetical protein